MAPERVMGDAFLAILVVALIVTGPAFKAAACIARDIRRGRHDRTCDEKIERLTGEVDDLNKRLEAALELNDDYDHKLRQQAFDVAVAQFRRDDIPAVQDVIHHRANAAAPRHRPSEDEAQRQNEEARAKLQALRAELAALRRLNATLRERDGRTW